MNFSDLPPLHPAWVHFPIALIVMSFICDFFSRIYQSASLRSAGWWALIFGAVSSIVTVIFGYVDMNRASLQGETHAYVDLHLRIGWLLLAVVWLLTLWRANFRAKPERSISVPFLLTSFLIVSLTLFQGWFGGEIVYAQGAGVAATGQGTQTPEQAKKSLATVKRMFDAVPGFRSAQNHHEEKTIREPAGATNVIPSKP